jgi:hypothetical protein
MKGDPPPAARILLNAMRLVLAAFLFAALTRTIADADLWGHLLFGRDIVQLRGLPPQDPYSFTSDIAWVNHEWLAEVLAYGSYAIGGTAGLVALKSLLVGAMLAFVLVSLRTISRDPVVHDLLVFLAVAGTYGRSITFRPQVFSLVLFPAVMSALLVAERGRPRALLAVPAIFLLWANLHGGWIVGLAAFGIWGAWTFVRADRYGIKRSWLAAISFASIAATLANPYGIDLWDFLQTTVGFSRDIVDWQPLWRLPVALLTPWITASILVATAVYLERRLINPSHLAIVAMCWIGSIRVNRLDAFFVLSAVMLVGPAIRGAFRRLVQRSGAEAPPQSARAGSIVIGALAIGLVGATASRGNFACIAIDEQWAPEPAAVMGAKASGLKGRMLTFFDWGEYAIWHLAPEIKVSMDGRRETVYSEELIAAHFRIYRDAPDAIGLIDRIQPDYIWLPARLMVVKRLEANGWNPIFRGSKSALLARTANRTTALPEIRLRGARCFPGP